MKYDVYLFIACILIVTTSCSNQQTPSDETVYPLDTEFLGLIHGDNDLKLIHTDSRYGEWGGNTFLIRVFRERENGFICADFQEFEGSIKPPTPPRKSDTLKAWYEHKPLLIEKRNIQLSKGNENTVEDAVIELVTHKIKNGQPFNHAGIHNYVIFADSSLIIDDYPSTTWSNFQKLKSALLKN